MDTIGEKQIDMDMEVEGDEVSKPTKTEQTEQVGRLHKPTEKAYEIFVTKSDKYKTKLVGISKEIEEQINAVQLSSHETKAYAIEILEKTFHAYMRDSQEYIEYLERFNAVESERELNIQKYNVNQTKIRVEEILYSYRQPIHLPPTSQLLSDNMSLRSHVKSTKSSETSRSSASTILARQKAKAEAARENLEFVSREAELLKQKANIEVEMILKNADIEANLKNLKAEQESKIADTEMKVLIEELEVSDKKTDLSRENVYRRTEQYVFDQNMHMEENTQQPMPKLQSDAHYDNHGNVDRSPGLFRNRPVLRPLETDQTAAASVPPISGRHGNQNELDMSKFLIKKELVTSRFSKFTDKPEAYLAWKCTFKSVMHEIGASSSEELDLMIKWLGTDSARQVSSIKISNAGNISRGLERAWDRLDSYYGSPERVENALKQKLRNLPKVTYKDKMKLYELSDTLNEILAVKEDPKYSALLGYFDSSVGINPVVYKLPIGFQNKWRDKAVTYKRQKNVAFPPFSFFCTFVQQLAVTFNDPGFDFGADVDTPSTQRRGDRRSITVNKNSVTALPEPEITRCPIHKTGHSLNTCRIFTAKSIDERRQILKRHGQCFKCCDGKHRVRDCDVSVKCEKCSSERHSTGMHIDFSNVASHDHGGESDQVNTNCTELCGDQFHGKSCAKIVLITIGHKSSAQPPVRAYAILDEQSNKSLARKELFDIFDPNAKHESYQLSTCGGRVTTSGRRSSGFYVESLDGNVNLKLPTIIECDAIPNNRHEIPTQDVALYHPHLSDLSKYIPPLDENADILLLIGRDLLSVHQVLEQRVGQSNQPFAQCLNLGWVIVGETCLDGVHPLSSVNVLKTMLKPSMDHTSILSPCMNKIRITEHVTDSYDIFRISENDNIVGMSVEDKSFVSLMDKEMKKDTSGNWIAPLPFKDVRPHLPNNRRQAMDRAKSLDAGLRKNPIKRGHFVDFMQGLLDSGHAELAPQPERDEECWYLPLFGVYHPQKKDRIRGVFDSSAKVQGVSLNSVLMSGPNLMNSLLGVLLRFRREAIAITADIQQMFYCFLVRHDHRKYLRFIWHADNDLEKPLVDYQMKVHVFGNSPSPAVATYGLRKTAEVAEEKYGSDMKLFVDRNFYVDDALSSHSAVEEAIDLLGRTRSALQEYGNLRLHKISSNSSDVLSAFDNNDLAKELKDFEFGTDCLPSQRSLGICWNLENDEFTFRIALEDKPFTRRGVLSSINSIFDPLGFVAPVTIAGKAILRDAMSDGLDWDEPLPPDHRHKWEVWKLSLQHLQNVNIARNYGNLSLNEAVRKDLCIFADASVMAIAAVAYIKLTDSTKSQRLGFMIGKAKLAPKHGHTIPRLELCAAVIATELYETIRSECDIDFDSVKFFTDSKVVLGYLNNETKRFFTYVENRVDRIRRCSRPSDWNYVPSKLNPADEATRSVPADNMNESQWLNGPEHLLCDLSEIEELTEFPLVDPDLDSEVRTMKMNVQAFAETYNLGSHRFERFSSWYKLVRAITNLKRVVSRTSNDDCQQHQTLDSDTRTDFKISEQFIIQVVQSELFKQEIDELRSGNPVPRSSTIRNLDPFINDDGLLCVGGRLRNADLHAQEKNPVIIPKKTHLAQLLIAHFHQEVQHQGRLLTEGAIRSAGFWIIGCRRLINSYLRKCVRCLKLRGKQQFPKMADLPRERLDPAPPFTYIGIDVFGPWNITTRKTRGGQAQSKRWAVIFTCLLIRAIHIEVIEEMTSSSFINALRRFIALRGEVKLIRSDCGTNFVGAAKEMDANIIHVDDTNFKDFLTRKGITWKFNPPHASHMGGVWERLIGVSRRILNALLMDLQHKNLTHEVLCTFMAEVCSIVNARPIAGVPIDPDSATPLTPSMLLNMKTTHTVDSFCIEQFSTKDIYKSQWKCVQHLANCFWKRWKNEFLPLLNERKKWREDSRNMQVGDVVLLKDKSLYRNDWPTGIIVKTITSDDSRVRKAEVRIGADKVYLRPVSEMILLVAKE